MTDLTEQKDNEAFAAGRAAGLAIAAVTIALVSYINLLGVEKSLLGISFAVIAYRGATNVGTQTHRLAVSAVVVSAIYLLALGCILVFAGDDLRNLIEAVDKVS